MSQENQLPMYSIGETRKLLNYLHNDHSNFEIYVTHDVNKFITVPI